MGTNRSFARVGVIPALALAVTLAGCQGLQSDAGDEPVRDQPPGVAVDPDSPLLQIDLGGGFVMVGYDFSTVPQLTVYADGRVIVTGPQIEIFPAPALPNLQVEQLSEADVEALIAAAFDAGLLGEIPDYGEPLITDVPTTFVTLTVDGHQYVHAAYALGIGEGEAMAGDDDLTPADLGITEEQLAARIALSTFIADANELVGSAGDGEFYEITAFGIFAMPATNVDEGLEDTEPEVQVLPWPLDLALADATECTLVDGADAQVLLETLAGANQATQFEQDGAAYQAGATYQVFFRPLLPHESGCEGLV